MNPISKNINRGFSLLEIIMGLAIATIGVMAVHKLIEIRSAQEKSLDQRSEFSNFRIYLNKKLDCQATLGFNRERCSENDGYLRLMITTKDGSVKPLGGEILPEDAGPIAFSHKVKNFYVRARCEDDFVSIAAAQYDTEKGKFAKDPINGDYIDFDHDKAQVFGDSAMICTNASDVPEGGDTEGTYGSFQKTVFLNTEVQDPEKHPWIWLRGYNDEAGTGYNKVPSPFVWIRGEYTPKGDLISLNSYVSLMTASNNASFTTYYQIEREGKDPQKIPLGKYDGDKTSIGFNLSQERLVPVTPGEPLSIKLMVYYDDYTHIEPCSSTNKCSIIRSIYHRLQVIDYFNE